MGNESRDSSLKSQVSSLKSQVTSLKSIEEGNNIWICLSSSVEASSWRLLQCEGGHQEAHWGLQLWMGLVALLVTFPL